MPETAELFERDAKIRYLVERAYPTRRKREKGKIVNLGRHPDSRLFESALTGQTDQVIDALYLSAKGQQERARADAKAKKVSGVYR